MPRRVTPDQLAAFLDRLARTGNIALAARDTAIARSTIFRHRARSAAFAARLTAALTIFRATHQPSPLPGSPQSTTLRGGVVGEGDSRVKRERGEGAAPPGERRHHPKSPHKTRGRELYLHTSRNRPPQLRRANPGHLTPAGVAAFLGSLGATANIRLSAESVGVAPSSAHARRRRDPAFAEAWDEALKLGCERLQIAMIERTRAFLEGRQPASPGWEQTGPTLEPPIHPEPRIAEVTMMDALALLTHHMEKKRRRQSEPVIKRQTLEELREGIMRKVAAVKRMHREEGWG